MDKKKFYLYKENHINYFLNHLKMLPEIYSYQDINRLVLMFFCVHGLAILDALDRIKNKKNIIDWVYSLQIHTKSTESEKSKYDCGFRGSSTFRNLFGLTNEENSSSIYDTSTIANTYAALCILKTLGDNLEKVNKKSIMNSLQYLQNEDTGCFANMRFYSEEDVRFIYCACAIAYILDDWSSINKTKISTFIQRCQTYEGGFGLTPGREAHGGATFCAVAALHLCGQFNETIISEERKTNLLRWLCFRSRKRNDNRNEYGGFEGRTNKEPDCCYSFWIGGVLSILNPSLKHSNDFFPNEMITEFVYKCQIGSEETKELGTGGFGKFPDVFPDLLHSYYSLAYLSIYTNDNILRSVNTILQVPPWK